MEGGVVILTFLWYSIRAGVPLLLGTAGEIITEKSGSLNLGVEGTMAVGAIGGYLAATACNDWFAGAIVAFLCAGLCGLLFSFLTVTLKANQNVTGLAITIFGVGFCQLIGQTLKYYKNTYPAMSETLTSAIADNGIPVLKDIPVIGNLLFGHNPFVYLAVAIAVACWIYLRFSKSGLRVRAIGENPGAADAIGINVDRKKYFNIILGSGIMGIGGLYMAMIINRGNWSDNWIAGYGWISIALVIFANWSTARAIFGSFFFGLLITLHAWGGNIAIAFPAVFGWLGQIPPEFYQMLPFLITVIVLVISSALQKKKQSAPAALGLNYFREER